MGRYLPDDNLCYPVLITIGDRSGSGFFVNHQSGSLFLVTARHVLFNKNVQDESYELIGDKANLTVYGKDLSINTPSVFELDLVLLYSSKKLIKHDNADIAIIKIAELSPASGEGGRVATFIQGVIQKINSGNSLVGVASDSIKKFSDILISNQAMILGYPNSLGNIQSGQIDYSRPLLRVGIVAGRNDTTMTVILDCPAYGGNSGGMAMEIEEVGLGQKKVWVIGIVAEFVPFFEQLVSKQYGTTNTNIENSGYSIVVPIDFALELMDMQH